MDRSEYLLEWTTCFAAKGDYLRAEGLLNDAIENLAEKDRFDLSTPAQQQRYRTSCRACADAYRDLMVVVTFGVQLWMYGTPVVYPLSMISNPLLRAVMIANPMTAPMESFRAVCFNSGEVSVLMWVISLAWTVVLLGVGISLFGKVEKTFVDTV